MVNYMHKIAHIYINGTNLSLVTKFSLATKKIMYLSFFFGPIQFSTAMAKFGLDQSQAFHNIHLQTLDPLESLCFVGQDRSIWLC